MEEYYFNTWIYVVETRNKIQGDALDLKWRITAERFLDGFSTEYNQEEFRSQFDFGKRTPVETIPSWIDMELNPPPEILHAFSSSLSTYLDRPLMKDAGYEVRKISLEEAFFGKPVKGIGNYSERKFRQMFAPDFEHFHHFVLKKRNQESVSSRQTDLFESFQEFKRASYETFAKESFGEENEIHAAGESNADEDTVETYLRGYRRWLSRNTGA